jgi:hypothetical protein
MIFILHFQCPIYKPVRTICRRNIGYIEDTKKGTDYYGHKKYGIVSL